MKDQGSWFWKIIKIMNNDESKDNIYNINDEDGGNKRILLISDNGRNIHIDDNPFVHMWIDCLDTEMVWLEAQIVDISNNGDVLVHYKGFASKWREWLNWASDRIAPLHTHTNPKYPLNNIKRFYIAAQFDALDTVDKWMRAKIIDLNIEKQQVKIRYLQWSEDYNEWLNADSYRLAVLHTHIQPMRRVDPIGNKVTTDRELAFKMHLESGRNLHIIEMEPDGNCLFRSVSFHVYGTPEYHRIVRQYCMNYVTQQQQFFRSYVEEDFNQYVERMKFDGEWGGELEIRAMGEIYGRPVEIYAYSQEPSRVYTGPSPNAYPIRVSYHCNSHYNAVVDMHDQRREQSIIMQTPGTYERQRLLLADPLKDENVLTEEERLLRLALRESRKEYDARDLDTVLDTIVSQQIEEAKRQSLIDIDGKEQPISDIDKAIVASLREETLRERDLNDDVALAKQLSMAEYSSSVKIPSVVLQCVEMGYNQDDVQLAYMIYSGENYSKETLLTNMLNHLNTI